jgi:hypothetical protein
MRFFCVVVPQQHLQLPINATRTTTHQPISNSPWKTKGPEKSGQIPLSKISVGKEENM